jgi:hypothetical protein
MIERHERDRLVFAKAAMIQRGANLLLALVILGCPLICRAGAPCCPQPRQATHGCPCCHATAGADLRPAPLSGDSHRSDRGKPGGGPMHGCQCVCGGAVPAKLVLIAPVPVAPLFPLVPADAANTCGALASTGAPHDAERDAGSWRSGRELCCLHMSFLC